MIRQRKSLGLACIVILTTLSVFSCGSGGTTNTASTGTLGLSLIDSPNPYKAIYVTINEVRVHHETDGWIILSELDLNLPQIINLLELVNGAMAYLGSTELAAGHYSQMRLILEASDDTPQFLDLNLLGNTHPYFNYLIDSDDNEIPLKVPSGGNTGIKLVNGFDIEVQSATELVLDFDALKSVVQAGNSGKWLLKPTIKVVETVTNTVSGTVTDEEDSLEIEGATVTAQKYDDEPVLPDEADRVVVAGGTESDEFGDYFMYLPLLADTEDPYNIVVTMAGYETACQQLLSNESMAHTADFALTALEEGVTGTLSASVEGLAAAEDSALFSVRQNYDGCGIIEVASFSVVNTMPSDPSLIYSDPITLPAGEYQVVISAEGQLTEVNDLTIQAGYDSVIDISY